jgi:hypothetical protein
MIQETIAVQVNGEMLQFRPQPLPQTFLEWQSHARLQMFEKLSQKGAGAVKTQPAHIAVMATMSYGQFPVNLASKGLGLLPAIDLVEQVTCDINAVRDETASLPVEESLPRRVAVMRSFYEDIQNFDDTILGGLEIFEGQTASNLARDPRASLLYSGEAPAYPSFQFNGVVRRVEGDDIYFKFLLAARELFALDQFHIHQVQYPFGYLFHVVETKDKTPYPRR